MQWSIHASNFCDAAPGDERAADTSTQQSAGRMDGGGAQQDWHYIQHYEGLSGGYSGSNVLPDLSGSWPCREYQSQYEGTSIREGRGVGGGQESARGMEMTMHGQAAVTFSQALPLSRPLLASQAGSAEGLGAGSGSIGSGEGAQRLRVAPTRPVYAKEMNMRLV